MGAWSDRAKVAGVAVVACGACCAGPLLGFVAAVSLGTLVGVALFGVFGLGVAVAGGSWWVWRRRQRRPEPGPVPVAAPTVRSRG